MRFSWRNLVSLFALLFVAGCFSSASSPPPYDSQKAKDALFQALEAWKKNGVNALGQGKPPLRFEDVDYRDGYRLVDYRLDEGQDTLRPFEDIRVKLSLADRRGAAVEKIVVYQVSLEPSRAVLRND